MTRGLAVIGVGLIALMLQTVVAHLLVGPVLAVDLVLVVVVTGGMMFGPGVGMAAGSVTGLAQDALSGGVLGVAGLAKTIAGFAAGVAAAQFIVSAVLPRFVAFAAMTWVHGVCFLGVYAMIEGTGLGRPWRALLVQSLVNALVGVVATGVMDRAPELWRRPHYRARAESRRFRR
jgi:rod shape-determining protein MreD